MSRATTGSTGSTRATIPISEGRRSPSKINFTKRAVEALPSPASGRKWYYDQKVAGLTVCVSAAGSKTYYRYRKVNGKPERYRLGKHPEITVEQARDLALADAHKIAEGRDPQTERQSKRAEMSFSQLWEFYLETHAKPHKKSWQGDESTYNSYLAGWERWRLSSITRQEVRKLHGSMASTPYAANRMLSLVSKMFSVAIEADQWEGANPCTGVKKFREKSRDRFLQSDEVPKFFESLNQEPKDTIRDYFMLALLTGARRSNLLAMRWEELHLDRAEWRIPETKNGEALTVHLSGEALDILKRRQGDYGESEWVFPSYGKAGHLADPKTAWKRIIKRAGLKDLRLHDLRRTLGSWQAAAGASLPVIGKSLGHKNQATTAIYARLNIDPVRQSVDAATSAIMEAANPAQETEVETE